jgi:hypothetical protein
MLPAPLPTSWLLTKIGEAFAGLFRTTDGCDSHNRGTRTSLKNMVPKAKPNSCVSSHLSNVVR